MTSKLNVQVYNPSNYERAGFVTMPCRDILNKGGIRPRELSNLAMYDAQGNPVPFQIDPVGSPKLDMQNLSRAVLTFHVSKRLQCGPDDYSNHSGNVLMRCNAARDDDVPVHNASEIQMPIDDELEIRKLKVEEFPSQQLELINSQLVVSFDLRPSSDPKNMRETWWYSGSATSIRLGGERRSRRGTAITGRDTTRRSAACRSDRIRVERHPSETSRTQEFSLFDRPYELISESVGPVRASITVASEPFDYGYYNSSAHWCRLECRLFRVISLYANVDYILEELFVEGRPKSPECGTKTCDIEFSARYFACMDMGFNPRIYQFAGIPDWFAIGRPEGYPQELHPGYGFACDIHVSAPLRHPVPDYHNGENATKPSHGSWGLACKRPAFISPCTARPAVLMLERDTTGMRLSTNPSRPDYRRMDGQWTRRT